MLEGVGQALLAEGQLADGPDLGVGLERLLDVAVERAALEGDDLGRRVRVVGDRGAALGAEEAPDALAGAALALVLLDGAVDGELVLGDDADEGWGRVGSALTDDVGMNFELGDIAGFWIGERGWGRGWISN